MRYTEFIHPEDASALKTLQSIPVLSAVMKKVMDVGVEQLQTGLNMASKIKLSPSQLPRLYYVLPPICERLEIKEPDFYLEMNPVPNAYAFGDTQIAITITSALVDMMSEEELVGVVAHECGHIACRHMSIIHLHRFWQMLRVYLRHWQSLQFPFTMHLCIGSVKVN